MKSRINLPLIVAMALMVFAAVGSASASPWVWRHHHKVWVHPVHHHYRHHHYRHH